MKTKRLVALLLIVTMTVSMGSFGSYTATAATVIDDPYFVNGDSGKRSENVIDLNDIDLTSTDKSAIFRDYSFLKKEQDMLYDKLMFILESRGSIVPFALQNYSGSIGVSVCTQEESYYCGPATVQQTIKYMNGYAESQSTIAKSIGTTTAGSVLSDMVKYVNNNKSYGTGYIIISNPSEGAIQSMVDYGVTNKMPVMCRLKFSSGGNWIYSTEGHYMNANGYTNYGNSIYVTDPNIKRVSPSASGSYWVTISELYKATSDHFAREMAY